MFSLDDIKEKIINTMFEKKYPLLKKYIKNTTVRNNMNNNKDLYDKYIKHEEMISTFLFEIDKSFDLETINKMIKEVILQFPDELLVSFITAYLNSSEISKRNIEVVSFFNKTAQFGTDCIRYMEVYGITTNRSYKDIPNKVKEKTEEYITERNEFVNQRLNEEFNEYNVNLEINGVYLKDIYDEFELEEKMFVNDLIKTNNINILNLIFNDTPFKLNIVIKILSLYHIDSSIINNELLEKIGLNRLTNLVYSLIESCIKDKDELSVLTIKDLIKYNRFFFIIDSIDNGNIKYISCINEKDIEKLSDTELNKIINYYTRKL